MKKYFAELVGTFILVLFGCGTAVVAGDKVGIVGIAFAFGFALIGAAYGIGPISGCHINPAVSLGVWAAGRMKTMDVIGYWVGQFAGGILAAWVLSFYIVGGVAGGYNVGTAGLGQNGWGAGYQGEYNLISAIAFEFMATLIFVLRHSRRHPEGRTGRVCRPRHWHHAGGHSHLRHSHHRCEREPGAKLWSGLTGRGPRTRASVALPLNSQHRRCGRRTAFPVQGA